jgi:hypothetical protein
MHLDGVSRGLAQVRRSLPPATSRFAERLARAMKNSLQPKLETAVGSANEGT